MVVKALITGSGGLIGSEAARHFHSKGFSIVGIDDNSRAKFFGSEGSSGKNLEKLRKDLGDSYQHSYVDLKNYLELELFFKKNKFDVIIHTAAQPSHDWSAKDPITDFTVNAVCTINLLELTRLYNKDATFIFTSTNKVYGDRPNISYIANKPDSTYKNLEIRELGTRYEGFFVNDNVFDLDSFAGIDEAMSIDQSVHSPFGVSKASADLLCQEYGQYYDMNVGIFRCGCVTGAKHAGVELHGFLSYLVHCAINNKPYTIWGYKGKQTRDIIHSFDLVDAFWHFYQFPKKGKTYNIGGGRKNNVSVLEAIDKINCIAAIKYNNYTVSDNNRKGDHVWYISNYDKFSRDYPEWSQKYNIDDMIIDLMS